MQSLHFLTMTTFKDGNINPPLFPSVERVEGLDRYYRNLCHAANMLVYKQNHDDAKDIGFLQH